MLPTHHTARHVKRTLTRVAIVTACLLGNPPVASAQQQPTASPVEPSQPKQDLTEGLLDLLTEPAPKPVMPSAVPEGNAPDTRSPAAPEATPSTDRALPSTPRQLGEGRGLGTKDRGADDLGGGEDLGASGTNPLAEVQLGMQTAAGWLRERTPAEKTEELQRDIVARLDQLIDDLNQQSPIPSQHPRNESQNPSTSQSPQQNPSQEQAAQQGQKTDNTGQQQAERDATAREQANAESSGTQGQPVASALSGKGGVVDLNDPTALQRSVWGNLPDRVREQMQSRMVERFLPGYREEIEAYYRALSR